MNILKRVKRDFNIRLLKATVLVAIGAFLFNGIASADDVLRPVAAGEREADARAAWLEENLLRRILPPDAVAALRGRDLVSEAGGLRALIAILSDFSSATILRNGIRALAPYITREAVEKDSYVWRFGADEKERVTEVSDKQWLIIMAKQHNITKSGRCGYDGPDYKSVSFDGGKTYISLIPPREAGMIYWLTFYWPGYDWEKRDYYVWVTHSSSSTPKQDALLIRGVSAPTRNEAIDLFKVFLTKGATATGYGGSKHTHTNINYSPGTVNMSFIINQHLTTTAAWSWARMEEYGWLYVFRPELIYDRQREISFVGHGARNYIARYGLSGMKNGGLVRIDNIYGSGDSRWENDEVHLREGLAVSAGYILGIVPSGKMRDELLPEFNRLAKQAGVEIRWLKEDAPLWEIIDGDMKKKRCQGISDDSALMLTGVLRPMAAGETKDFSLDSI
jgi:hypothetical protein